jgi:hypothetical protein
LQRHGSRRQSSHPSTRAQHRAPQSAQRYSDRFPPIRLISSP